MAAFLCKNTAVKEDNWGCHDDGLQQADGAVFVCRTSNGIKAPSAPHRRLWFELGTEFQSLSSNSRSIWNTPLQKKRRKWRKGPRESWSRQTQRSGFHQRQLSYLFHLNAAPKGWQADQRALCSLRKPAAHQRPVDGVIKTLLPPLLLIKYFHAFVNRFSAFSPTGDRQKKSSFCSLDVLELGRPKFRRQSRSFFGFAPR